MAQNNGKKKYRYIANEFWDDKYIRSLEPIEKYVFLYLLTNPHFHISGVYSLTMKRAAIETDLGEELIQNCLAKFAHDDKIFYLNNAFVVIPKSLAYKPLNTSIMTSVIKVLNELPQVIKKSSEYTYYLEKVSRILDASEINGKDVVQIKKQLTI